MPTLEWSDVTCIYIRVYTCCMHLRLSWGMLRAFYNLRWSISHVFTSEWSHVAYFISELSHVACIYTWVDPCCTHLRLSWGMLHAFYNLRWTITHAFTYEWSHVAFFYIWVSHVVCIYIWVDPCCMYLHLSRAMLHASTVQDDPYWMLLQSQWSHVAFIYTWDDPYCMHLQSQLRHVAYIFKLRWSVLHIGSFKIWIELCGVQLRFELSHVACFRNLSWVI